MNTPRVKIIGAGSAGCDLAYACRMLGFDVTMIDNHDAPLARLREEIYPARYGVWDKEINLCVADGGPKNPDVIMIANPTSAHVNTILNVLNQKPRVLFIESPLGKPLDIDFMQLAEVARRHNTFAKDTMMLVGYNHLLTPSVQFLAKEVKKSTVQVINVTWLETGLHSGQVMLDRSAGLNLWQYLANQAGWGRITRVQQCLDQGSGYEVPNYLDIMTESGGCGRAYLDISRSKPWKRAQVVTLQKGEIIWQYREFPNRDTVRLPSVDGDYCVSMTPADDIKYEISHIADLLEGKADYADSPLHIRHGFETLKVLRYAQKSFEAGNKPVDVPKWFSEF